MLDMEHGIFPHVTYANTTSKNALEVLKTIGLDNIVIYLVTRCYQTRHGNGWMSNQDLLWLKNTQEEINVTGEWQGEFRKGELDYDLLNYAIDTEAVYSRGIPRKLVVTCLDQREDFTFDAVKLGMDGYYASKSPQGIKL
jgi:adenylosuccinate synthase